MQPICLVIPPSPFLLDERVFMALGILKVAASLEAGGYVVEMVDLSGVSNFEEAMARHARATRAQCFGLTATTPQMPAASRLAEVIRRERPGARLILGGPHPTLVRAAARQETRRGITGRAHRAKAALELDFDVLVAGDGEEAIFHAIREGCPQWIDADDPASALWQSPAKLAANPWPARHLVDVDSYRYSIDGVRALSLIAQLGCPFACGFCGGRATAFLRRVRLRPEQSVVDEISMLHQRYGVNGFMLYDDELNVNPKMPSLMRAIRREADRLGTRFHLRGFLKSELFTDEQAEAMVEAGFRWILVGFESGSPAMLRRMRKGATREQNTECIRIAHRHGLKVKALMSLGHPGESETTVRETRDWLLEVRPDDFDLTLITTYPGTPYYDESVPVDGQPGVWRYTIDGDNLYSLEVDYTQVAHYYKGDPEGGYQSYVFTDYLSRQRLVQLRNETEHEVRERLGIPYPNAHAGLRYEHSMGQSGLPPTMLRSSVEAPTRDLVALAHASCADTAPPHLVTIDTPRST
jgi:radical SAM superfamily enzyme YgiQ (UPF0313 family)